MKTPWIAAALFLCALAASTATAWACAGNAAPADATPQAVFMLEAPALVVQPTGNGADSDSPAIAALDLYARAGVDVPAIVTATDVLHLYTDGTALLLEHTTSFGLFGLAHGEWVRRCTELGCQSCVTVLGRHWCSDSEFQVERAGASEVSRLEARHNWPRANRVAFAAWWPHRLRD